MKQHAIINKSFLRFCVSNLLLIIILASCGKKDSSIATDTKAATVVTNGVASVGPAGPHNNLVYYGNTDPDPLVGCLGDYYLDVNKGVLYGPKVTNGWSTFLVLSGATAAENKVFSGTNIPELNLGNTGDYYVSTSDFMLYGPRKAAEWGTPIDLQHQGK